MVARFVLARDLFVWHQRAVSSNEYTHNAKTTRNEKTYSVSRTGGNAIASMTPSGWSFKYLFNNATDEPQAQSINVNLVKLYVQFIQRCWKLGIRSVMKQVAAQSPVFSVYSHCQTPRFQHIQGTADATHKILRLFGNDAFSKDASWQKLRSLYTQIITRSVRLNHKTR